ncbi:MAG: serine/threonine protein phosphatase [Myxococcales bacterium]|nr:serine/threonine protein phosphatase [Myxococcales bacterium]
MLEVSRDPIIAEQQVRAIVYMLVAFAYVDGEFEPRERDYIFEELDRLAERRASSAVAVDAAACSVLAQSLAIHQRALVTGFDATVRGHFTESVADGETHLDFVLTKLKVGCLELLAHFEPKLRAELVQTVEKLMHADGRVDPRERAFFDEVSAYSQAPIEFDDTDSQALEAGAVIVEPPRELAARVQTHPFFLGNEVAFASDPAAFREQSEREMALCDRVAATLVTLREGARNRLAGLQTARQLAVGERVLDGYVYAHRPDPARRYELLVLGDLHGCYSCLKAALLQADFFERARLHRESPAEHPEPGVVLLGDYVDRGRFGFEGTLRLTMELVAQYPEYVVALRGNHEFYIEQAGRIVAPVRPCESLDALAALDSEAMLARYRKLFDDMPTSYLFGTTIFAHGGIPRDQTLETRWRGLHSLNDPAIRFEMLWSDPSPVDVVPRELQRQSARFAFGRRQLKKFLALTGCTLMVRGHDRVLAGFELVFDEPGARLITLFSSGGATNADLPAKSNYREVRPKAMRLTHEHGVTTVAPFPIDYAAFQAADTNGFFETAPPTTRRVPGP